MPRSFLLIFAVVAAPRLADAGVHLDHFVATIGGARAVIDGTISPSVDLTVTFDRWRLGEVVARDVVVKVRESHNGLRACATARVSTAAVEACGTLTRSYSQLSAMTWRVHTGSWSIRGNGTVTRQGQITAHAVIEGGATAEVDMTGSVSDLETRGELRLGSMHVPFTGRANLREGVVAVHVGGIELASLLPARLLGTGVLDGDFALRFDGSGASLISGNLRARGPGRIRVTDASWLPEGDGLKHRLAATLADFEYTELAAVISPRGVDPDVRVSIRGRGTTVPQELDLVINFHGARAVAQHLVSRVRSSS